MLIKSKGPAILSIVITITIYMCWPKSNEIPVSPEVEAAINSIKPVPVVIPADRYDTCHKISLGIWSSGPIPLAFREWNDGHVSRNNLKTKTSVLTRSDAVPVE